MKIIKLIFTALLLQALMNTEAAGSLLQAKALYSQSNFNYISIGINKNHPIERTNIEYNPGYPQLSIAYRSFTKDSWLLGISSSFKNIKTAKTNDDLSFWLLSQEILHNFRVYHPFHLALGVNISYMLPVKKRQPPFGKHDEVSTEIGSSLVIMLNHLINDDFFYGISILRWRGNNTNKFHGTEIMFSLNLNTNLILNKLVNSGK